MNRIAAEKKLKEIFHIEHFFDTQWAIIDRIFKGERALLIEKTGFGKSLCFQFPAIFFDGITIVFTPLIALMRDQVNKLNALGINAKCINSNQDNSTNSKIIQEALNNEIKILYIAPERMENIEWINSARQINISMVVVDEAHCISTWGHDFRPAYKRIVNLVNLLPASFPVLATTATATKKVEEDIKRQIGKKIFAHRGNLLRPNFRLFVIKVQSEDEKFVWLAKNLNNIDGTGLIYTGTRADTEIYSRWLQYIGISAVFYNGDLDANTRENIEKGLLENRWKCIVSTNALGMGIDKPDIRFIIHTQTPISPIHYYQEIGRAGRDGKKTFIILFFNPDEDMDLPRAFIEGSKPSVTKYKKLIKALKNERLGEHELVRETNLKYNEVRTIKADLLEQNIINEVYVGKNKKYEIKFNAPELNLNQFDELRTHKIEDFNKMLEYIDLKSCRMDFLCKYLGDNNSGKCNRCDNDTNHIVEVDFDNEWRQKVQQFHGNNFPVLELHKNTILKIEKKESLSEKKDTPIKKTSEKAAPKSNFKKIFSPENNSNLNEQLDSSTPIKPDNSVGRLIDGVAASYYGVSDVGKIIHRCKYENGGDYPDLLVNLAVKAYKNKFTEHKFDMIVYVPPTESGDLVKNFAQKLSVQLQIPLSHNLIKTRQTSPQKVFQNYLLKKDNIKNVFSYSLPDEIKSKSILLVDDIYDSGTTIKEIGKYLTELGAKCVAPLVIAKTVGGDIS